MEILEAVVRMLQESIYKHYIENDSTLISQLYVIQRSSYVMLLYVIIPNQICDSRAVGYQTI